MVESVVKELVSSVFKSSMEGARTGDRCRHKDGYEVEIVKGQYWGKYGISNFWYWRRVREDGTLADETEHGYGTALQRCSRNP